jgi:hypothetical protein
VEIADTAVLGEAVMPHKRLSRMLIFLGIAIILAGCIDPLEASVVVFLGSGLVAAGGWRAHSRLRRSALLMLLSLGIGVGALVVLSMLGGVGGRSERSMLWLLVVVPYPLGATATLIFGMRMLRDPALRS